jgi:hypothetical protein
MAIACFRLFTRPPFPRFPERSVPRFLRRMALRTVLAAALPYLRRPPLLAAIESSCKLEQEVHGKVASEQN